MKEFKPRTKKISTIGEELRFQREYYCFKNNIHLPLKIDNNKINNIKTLGQVLSEFMDKNLNDDNSEYATNYDILYAIENGKSKKRGEKYNVGTYYVRMFFLLKLYNFLDTKTILELLNKYKVEPRFESSKRFEIMIMENESLENNIQRGELDKIININIKDKKIRLSKEQYLNFFNFSKDELDYIEKTENKHENTTLYTIKNGKIIKKQGQGFIQYGYDWSVEYKQLAEKMKKLSEIERYYTSLELGKETTYINDFINDKLQNINLRTMMKTLEYFKNDNTSMYQILAKMKNNFSYETLKTYIMSNGIDL